MIITVKKFANVQRVQNTTEKDDTLLKLKILCVIQLDPTMMLVIIGKL